MLDERKVFEVLRAIENGDVSVTADGDPAAIYCGNVTYKTSNGWTLIVFNDCAEWDYLDAAETPDGERICFDDMSESLQDYSPPEDQWMRIWGI